MDNVIICEEKLTIPTYPVPVVEEMPMFAECREHQGTSGNPYPSRVVQKVDREHRADRDYIAIRLENDYIRVIILPELGGRIFEAYDKVNDYNFLYRQHVIKPALIGAFGSWISGGMEFNWPFHHRPSTFLPVDYSIEKCDDGSAICWLSECDPRDRTKGMVGIVLKPDASYFETRVKLSNRTPFAQSFLWWENAAVRVHEKYRLNFPPDVTWAHHHYDRSHVTFPLAQGQYGSERFDELTDISWHKATRNANSYFAAPSDFDFFGGYDYERECGTLHIADHQVSPGKKMFTWGYGKNAENWEDALTDEDGPYAELMAGSYTDDQPDFSYIAPYETKCFSQYWYPTRKIGYVTAASLNAAVAIERKGADSTLRLNATSALSDALLTVSQDGVDVLHEKVNIVPCECKDYTFVLSDVHYTVKLTDSDGSLLLEYTEIDPDYIHIPKDNHGIPTPDTLHDAQSLTIAGMHIDQYRDPIWKGDSYYREALKYSPEYLPALTKLGETLTRRGKFDEALKYLEKASKIENTYNTNPYDGTVGYLKALCYLYKEDYKSAVNGFEKAAWSANVIAASMSHLAAMYLRRGEYAKALAHAEKSLDKEAHHPTAGVYAALAEYRMGHKSEASAILDTILSFDPLNQTARFVKAMTDGCGYGNFISAMHSDPSQTCLDIAFELREAGLYAECTVLFAALIEFGKDCASAMALYCYADCLERIGEAEKAAEIRTKASEKRIVDVFPYRLDEIALLRDTVNANPEDGTAWYLLGCVLYDKQHYNEALEAWKNATKYSPDFYIPYRCIAVALYSHLGRRDEALEWQKKAVQCKPNDEQLLNETAFLMAVTGVDGHSRAEYIKNSMPGEGIGDDLYLELAKAYNASGEYDEARNVMLSHSFTPGEGGEFIIAETYMFGRFAAGRCALAEGRTEEALTCFREALDIPANLHAGYWNESVTVPYRYYEAETLSRLGRTEEAKEILGKISKLNNGGMWNMGGEFVYYSALISRLDGKEAEARATIRNAISSWERQLENPGMPHVGTHRGRFFYLSFIDDAEKLREANLCYMLGYGMLAYGDEDKAKEYFERSLALDPDNVKCALELKLLK